MSNINFLFIEEYIRELIPEKPEFLKKLREYASENHIPIVEEETEEFLKFLLDIKRPKTILELGCAIGYSSIVFAKNEYVEYVKTVEIREEMKEIAEKNIKEAKLDKKIKVFLDDAYEFLCSSKDSFDMIFIDAAKGQYEKYFNEAIKLLNKDGIIICDNVLFKGMVANDELIKRRKITIVKRLRKFLSNIKKDEKFISSIVPIGDGVLLVRRKDG